MGTRRADDSQYPLASNVSATGGAVAVKGGTYTFTAEGTVGGATVGLQMQTPNGTWSDVSVFNASAVKATVLPYVQVGINLPACNVRFNVAGGAPSALYGYLLGEG